MIDAGRTSVANTGEAFAANAFTLWGYNTRSELESSKRYTGTYTPTPDSGDEVTSQRRLYEYDPIGNRTESTKGTGSATFYCANELNQYKATRGAGDSCPTPTSPTEAFEYDADGNLIEDGQFVYTWDGENRLIAVAPASSPVNGDKKLEFQYDYMSRRVEKKVYTYSSGWGSPTEVLRFVYDRWNVILVLDGLDDNAALKKYTWGLDLSGQRGNPTVEGIHGAGGIGGLLAVEETAATGSPAYWFFYDANGNVGQAIKASDQSLAAHYEYDPYGNVLNTPTGYAAANPFRFSTKWLDTETGLCYYGYRYYSPRMGRWVGRDPIEEAGGLNLYRHARNCPSMYFDALGLYGSCSECLAFVDPEYHSSICGGICGTNSVTKAPDDHGWRCAEFSGEFFIPDNPYLRRGDGQDQMFDVRVRYSYKYCWQCVWSNGQGSLTVRGPDQNSEIITAFPVIGVGPASIVQNYSVEFHSTSTSYYCESGGSVDKHRVSATLKGGPVLRVTLPKLPIKLPETFPWPFTRDPQGGRTRVHEFEVGCCKPCASQAQQ